MAATTTTITFDFTATNPLKRWQFNPNGATSYFFSDSTISGPTAQTVAEGSLFKISRSDDQYNGLTEGSGASISLDASMNELLGISSTNTFVKRLIIVPFFRTFNNYYNMNQQNNIFSGEAGRWITGKWSESAMFKSKIRFINRSDNYYMESWPSGGFNISGQNWGNFKKDVSFWEYEYGSLTALVDNRATRNVIFHSGAGYPYDHPTNGSIYNTGSLYETGDNALTSNAVGNLYNSQYKYLDFSPGNGTEGLVSGSNDFGIYYDYPLLTSERVRFEIPFVISIPRFQHVWTDWPWNKGRKTLTTDLVFTKIEFRVMYDTISEYKTKFYTALDLTAGNNFSGATVWLDPEKTRKVPEGYLAVGGKYFVVSSNGITTAKRTCQSNLTVGLFGNGTVSSTYPSTASGSGTYAFDQDVTYITLQSSATYGDTLTAWRVVDFDGNSTDLSPTSSINIYNGVYESVTAIYTSGGNSPTCYRYIVTYTAFVTYFPCGESETSSQFFSGDEFCAESVTGGATNQLGRCDEYV